MKLIYLTLIIVFLSACNNNSKNIECTTDAFSNVQLDIYQAGGLHEYGKSLEVA